MLNCLYRSNRICSLDIKDNYNQDNYELEKEWRNAGDNDLLTCEDCGSPVFLKAGKKKIAHFAHKPGINVNCYNIENKETEEHRKAKQIFYFYFRGYPDVENVDLNYKHSTNKRSDIFVKFKSGEKLAIEFLLDNLNIKDWQEKHGDYLKLGIYDLWFLSIRTHKTKEETLNFTEKIMLHETCDRIIKYLDVEKRRVTLVKRLYNDKEKLFEKSYHLKSIQILPTGYLVSQFDEEFENAKKKFIQESKTEQLDESNLLVELFIKLKSKKITGQEAKTFCELIKKNDLDLFDYGIKKEDVLTAITEMLGITGRDKLHIRKPLVDLVFFLKRRK